MTQFNNKPATPQELHPITLRELMQIRQQKQQFFQQQSQPHLNQMPQQPPMGQQAPPGFAGTPMYQQQQPMYQQLQQPYLPQPQPQQDFYSRPKINTTKNELDEATKRRIDKECRESLIRLERKNAKAKETTQRIIQRMMENGES